MPKIIPTKISKTERDKLKNLLCNKIAKLKTGKEVSNFLEDLLTESEFVMMIRRLEVAKLLLDGYLCWQIKDQLRVSYNTIEKIREKLNKERGGFLNFIKNLK